MATMRLKELGILGIVLGLTLEAPVFAQETQEAEGGSTQQSTPANPNEAAGSAAQEGRDGAAQDDAETDTEGGMVREESAGFGSGGEAMPGTELPDPPQETEQDPGKE
ncbi:hypothetical protein SAMN02745148_00560 [Modicisalibacter ilicicola DSM 19980]|uniref:Uncharacterized protein n=1 Tax=Modicisalibacter ilicicola DSM 19980 TaxID=1121942 RepID=A0A1M4UAD3_9GAMM|nr:hypothetical protein [Halomonas ilicicola]SHE53608.1 hypothetical protein SAMN02745148_00560 [Halomonas ilicicola DSM 19980]